MPNCADHSTLSQFGAHTISVRPKTRFGLERRALTMHSTEEARACVAGSCE